MEPVSDDAVTFTVLPGGEQADAPVVQRRVAFCPHHQTELDSDARKVSCTACGRELDAFDVLAKLAHEPQRWINHRDRVHSEAQQAQRRLDEVKRELRNAQARLRRRG